MSDDGTMATPPGTAREGQGTERKLYDAAGEPVHRNAQPPPGQVDQLATFVREQPLSAVLAAIIIGYLLGKIT